MSIPLCVDLDGTLIKTDLLFESFLILIKRNPLYVFTTIIWLFKGIACLKYEIAKRVSFDPSILPYSKDFLIYLKDEHAKGRELILVTAADKRFAEIVSDYIGIFSNVIASDGYKNLKGKNKEKMLCEFIGKKKYDYAGNDKNDLKVWSSARCAVIVNANRKIVKRVSQLTELEKVFSRKKNTFFLFLKAIRIHQYVKNLLIFVPLFASHNFQSPFVLNALIAFISFCLLASSVYLMNDLFDLEADRKHRIKIKRPFASGDLSIKFGVSVTILFSVIGILLAMTLNKIFLFILLSYFALSTAYSFILKQKLLFDVLVLAILYTIRIIAGVAAIQSEYSEWLLTFSIFFFLSLAFVKRYSELYLLKKENQSQAIGRSYHIDDLNQLSIFGTVSGYIATFVFAFYIRSSQVVALYYHPQYLWLVCLLLLYWISRIWLLTTRGLVNEDPVVFALQDRTSFLVVFAIALVMFFASF